MDGSIVEDRVYNQDGAPLSSTNNVSKWLDKLRFRYVPAIKGQEYFSALMGELYDVLNEVHGTTLREQGEEFINGIQAFTEQITDDLSSQLGIANTIQVPSDFKSLFSNLDFGYRHNGFTYHLKQRGDGVKVRHIPVILKYMSDQEKNMSIPGYVKPDTIWGFEEPENNLELMYAFELARMFKGYSSDIQIFITTHSPAFYALDVSESDGVNTFYVSQDDRSCTGVRVVTHQDTDSLHETMGLLPLITPYLKEIYEHQERIELLRAQLDSLSDKTRCFVMTEDEDQEAISRLLEINGFRLNTTEIISYFGADQMSGGVLTAKYLAKKFPGSMVVIHRDRDYLDEDKVDELRKKVEKNGFIFYVTKGVDVESEFISAEHIHSLYPQLSVDEIENMIIESTDEAESDSIGRLIDQSLKTEKPKNNGYYKKVQELEALYAGDKLRYRYGKKVIGLVKAKVQKAIGENPDFYRYSNFVERDELTAVSMVAWQ
jgi:hypothetical protein